MPEEVYHGRKELSSTMIKALSVSVENLKELMYGDRNPFNKNLRDGKIVHDMIQGSDHFYSKYAVAMEDAPDRRNKKWWKEFQEEFSGKIAISHKEWMVASNIKDSLAVHPIAGDLILDSEQEVSLFARDPLTGVKMRARLDILKGNIIADLKTTINANASSFYDTITKYRLDLQAVHYMSMARLCGIQVDRFFFIAAEKTDPYLVEVYEQVISPELVEERNRLITIFRAN